jgi:uncharacterized membrane protein
MMPASLTARISNLALLITMMLLVVLLMWQLSGPSSAWRWTITALLALPVALVLASLLRHRPCARAWTILGAIPCVTLGIVELIANPGERLWALACAVIGFGHFVVLAWLLRAQAAR